MRSPLEQFDIRNIKNIYTIYFDITIQNVLLPLVCLILCIYIYIYINIHNIKLIPIYIQYIVEIIYKFLIDLVKQQIGNYGLFRIPFIFNLFFMILLCNILSLIPFGIALTSHLIVTM